MGRSMPCVSAPLAPFSDGFRRALAERGYACEPVRKQMLLMAHVSRWLACHGLGPAELTGTTVERFLAARCEAGYRDHVSLRAMSPLLGYLRAVGVVPSASTVAASPEEVLLERYAGYLANERGLVPGSVAQYVRAARMFLHHDEFDVAGLNAAQVAEFVLSECRRGPAAYAKRAMSRLRSLLRFLFVEGLTEIDLAPAVPSVASRRLESLPKAVDRTAVAQLLGGCDRRTVVGRRDFAILTVLARLGLRAGEVAKLQLRDIDWRNGEMVVRGKGNRMARLPVPVDVGEAIVGWLQRGRPRCDCPYVFTRMRAPIAGLSAGGVSMVVATACRRAGLPVFHAHRLRHTVATELLRAGAGLVEVGQVLRHRSQHTTSLYAKIDQRALSGLVQPWPGGAA
jgi:integrase/recombinase XerD